MERSVANILLPEKAIIAGDFNAHHPWWNSNVQTPKRAEPIINWTDSYHVQLINKEDTPTYHYRNGTGTSILDLTFVTPSSTESITSWAVDDEATTGSDHEVICFDLSISPIEDTVTHPICLQFNFKMADWTLFNSSLLDLQPATQLQMEQRLYQISDSGLEQAATILRDTLLQAATATIPFLRPSPRSKP